MICNSFKKPISKVRIAAFVSNLATVGFISVFLTGVPFYETAFATSEEPTQEGNTSDNKNSQTSNPPKNQKGINANKKEASAFEDLTGFMNSDDAPSQTSADIRKKSRFGASAIAFSTGTWIPYKAGLKLNFNLNENYTFEAEYLTATLGLEVKGLQLLGFKESLMIGNANIYTGSNSFHWIVGIGQRKYKFFIGKEFFSDLASAAAGIDLSLIKVQSNFLNLGLGNTWILDNRFKLGIDWFNMYIPFGETKVEASFLEYATDADDVKLIKTIAELLGDTPTFSLFKIHLGYSF